MSPDLRPYPNYKPSGIQWLGDIPTHWEARRISSCISGLESGSREQSDVGQHNGVPNLGGEHIGSDSQLRLENMRYVSQAFFENLQKGIIQTNDILLVKDGATIGKVAFIRDMPYQKCSINEHVFIIRAASDILPSLLFWNIRSQGVQEGIWQHTTGSAQPGLNASFTKSISIPLPPLAEQTAIVRYLDDMDDRIQRYVAAKRKLVELLEERRRAVVHRAVTRGLDPNVQLRPSGIEWLGDVPAHWETRRLKALVADTVDSTTERRAGEIYLALEHVEGWTGRYRDSGQDVVFGSQVKRFQVGDVLFGKLRPYLGKVTCPDRNGVCVGEFLVLRPHDYDMTSTYLERLLRSKPVIDAITASTFGAKMPRADWQFIGNMYCPIPPVEEQAAIVEYLDRATGEIDDAIARAQRQVELMTEYRARLIADVVTGKVDVREAARG